MDEDIYYYSKDVAKFFKLSSGSIAHWIKKGILPPPEVVKCNRILMRRWLKKDIDPLILKRKIAIFGEHNPMV